VSFRVRVKVEEDARRKLEAAPAAIREALGLAVRDVADEILARSQELVPVDKGTLRKSGNVRYADLAATVGYNAPYAYFVHEGTRPHEIVPRRARVLAFPPSGARGAVRGGRRVGVFEFGGRQTVVGLVFARRVMHPGTKAVKYLEGAVRAVEPLVPEFLRRRISEALAKAFGGGPS